MDTRRETILDDWIGTARLLRVHRAAVPGRSDWQRARQIQLTFDGGALHVRSERNGAALVAERVAAETDPEGMELAVELDPWWAVLGETLYGAWRTLDADGDVRSIELKLRADDANPKTIRIEARGTGLRIEV